MLMKDFKEFLKDFKELNPKLSRSELEKRAKEAYDEEKKKYKEALTIIKIPSIDKIEKDKEEEKTKQKEPEPEKTPEELAQEKKEEEERIAKELRLKNVQKIIELWSAQLQRSIEGKPFPQFPLHPTSRRLATPTDLYHLVDTIQEDDMGIELPALLTLLISDHKVCTDCYRAFINNPLDASNKLAKYFKLKNIAFHPELSTWQSPMMPPIRREFITHSKGTCKQFMPLTLKLDEEMAEDDDKSPLDTIHSFHDLIEKINEDPSILQKVSDHELEFYGIQSDRAMEIRKIAGEKKKKRDKLLKELVQEIIEKNKENNKEEQTGGGKEEEVVMKKMKRDLALYASMLL
jgi:uncharacterized protein (UPF0305 family)